MTDNQQPTDTAGITAKTAEEAIARSHGNPIVVKDASSDLVDTDPTFVTEEEPPLLDVHYAFAGAGMAGENMTVCSVCSAIVKDSGQDGHTQWHRNGSA